MSDASRDPDSSASSDTSERDELRTIAFRMREIQRLLSVRVEQENRKLDAEGIQPVTDLRFQATEDRSDE